MATHSAFISILVGAGVLPLSAHALDTIDLKQPEALAMAASPSSWSSAGLAGRMQGLRLAKDDGEFDAARVVFTSARPDGEAFPVAVTATEVSGFLDHARLAAPRAAGQSTDWAAQWLAALAIVGLVAKRRLLGR
jgi:hypothetical protein